MSTQISASKNQIIRFKNVPVLTTIQLAGYFGTEPNNIKKNFSNNNARFIEGKHYFKLEGSELKEFKMMVNNIHHVSSHASRLILWTERGAARHAKMLDTEHAWDVFEKLEDCYFNQEKKSPVVHEPLPDTNNALLPRAEGRYFVENRSDGTVIIRQADQYTMIRRRDLDVVKKDCKTIIQELELFSSALERLDQSLELESELLPILGKLNWRGAR